MFDFKKLIVRYLKDIIQRLEDNECEMTETDAMDILKIINHKPMSKESACMYLNVSRSKFDMLIKENRIPQGRKRVGFKEKVWFQDELEAIKLKNSYIYGNKENKQD